MQPTYEQQLIQDAIARFALERVAPQSEQWAKNKSIPLAIRRELGELGALSLLLPEEYGGTEAGYLAYVLAIIEIAKADASLSTLMSVHNSLVILPILHFGNEAQKNTYLPKLANGAFCGAFGLTEPQAGSDAGGLKSTAVREGNVYILNGVKQFITGGNSADIVIVFASTDPSLGKKGISAFIVPSNLPGFEVTRIEEKMGQDACETTQLTFENMRIPVENRLGEEGEGYRIALSQLEAGRLGIAAQAIGIAQAALRDACAYAKDRITFGKPIFDHQAISFRLSDMATSLAAAQALVIQTAQQKDAGNTVTKEAAMAKLFASETAEKVCHDAIQVLGGYGYVKDFPLERYFRDVRVTSIYEGTSDMQRLIIARHLSV